MLNQKQYEDLQALMTSIMGTLSNYMAERARIEAKPNGKAEARQISSGPHKDKHFVYKSGFTNAMRDPKLALERVENIYNLKTQVGKLSDALSASRVKMPEVVESSETTEKKVKGGKQTAKKSESPKRTKEMSAEEVCSQLKEFMLAAKKKNSEISVKGGVVQNYEKETGSAWTHYATQFAALFSPSYRRPASDESITECETLIANFLKSNQPAQSPKNG